MSLAAARATLEDAIARAESGDVDPWDVQVIDAIDRFLAELERVDRANLPLSGQAFVWASMLVYFKAEALQRLAEARDEDEDAIGDPEELDPIAFEFARLPLQLERHLRRRAAAPPPRKRRVTLPELLAQIRAVAAEWDEAVAKDRPVRPRALPKREAAAAISQLAHDENLTDLAARLEALLVARLPEAGEACWLDLDQLLRWWTEADAEPDTPSGSTPAERHSPDGDRVGVFWALLLLSSQSKVELSQEEFYQDIHVRWLDETAAAEPVAIAS